MAKLKSRRGGGTLVTGSQRRGGCGCLSNGSRLPIPPNPPPVPRALPARRGGDPDRRRRSLVRPAPLPARLEHRPGTLPEGKPSRRGARHTRASRPRPSSLPSFLSSLPSPLLRPQPPLRREEEPFPTSPENPGRFSFREKGETPTPGSGWPLAPGHGSDRTAIGRARS